MKKLLLPLLLLLAACRKNPAPAPPPAGNVTLPAMRVIDLHNAPVRYRQVHTVDLDGDGAHDLVFKCQLVGSPSQQADRYQFCVQSSIRRNLLVNDRDETPPFTEGASIGIGHPGFNWWEVSHSVLAEKIVSDNETRWDGLWKTAQHRFLAVQVQRGADRYNGFVEISMDQAGNTLLLHRAALNLSPDVPIIAGR
ncbi:hypothetical protein [Flaviaesturariibacter terrae]